MIIFPKFYGIPTPFLVETPWRFHAAFLHMTSCCQIFGQLKFGLKIRSFTGDPVISLVGPIPLVGAPTNPLRGTHIIHNIHIPRNILYHQVLHFETFWLIWSVFKNLQNQHGSTPRIHKNTHSRKKANRFPKASFLRVHVSFPALRKIMKTPFLRFLGSCPK